MTQEDSRFAGETNIINFWAASVHAPNQNNSFREEIGEISYFARVTWLGGGLFLVKMTIEDLLDKQMLEDGTQLNTAKLIAKSIKNERFMLRCDVDEFKIIGEFFLSDNKTHKIAQQIGSLAVPDQEDLDRVTPTVRSSHRGVLSNFAFSSSNQLNISKVIPIDYSEGVDTMRLLEGGRIVLFGY